MRVEARNTAKDVEPYETRWVRLILAELFILIFERQSGLLFGLSAFPEVALLSSNRDDWATDRVSPRDCSFRSLMKRPLFTLIVVVGVHCLFPIFTAADDLETSSAAVTLEQIMADPDWIARSPETPLWNYDSNTIYFRRKRQGSEIRDWFRVSTDDHQISKVSLKDSLTEIPSRGRFSRDFSRELIVRHGDLFLIDHNSGETQQLTQTSAVESGPVFLANEERIQFRRAGTMLVRDLTTGLEAEPVRVLAEDAPKKEEPKADKPPAELLGFSDGEGTGSV